MLPRFTKQKTIPRSVIQKESMAKKYPFYVKAPLVLIGIYLLFNILQLLHDILVPICFATLIAILLNPVVNKLRQWKIPKTIAISLALLMFILVIGSIIAFFSAQLASFSELTPMLKKRGIEKFAKLQQWVASTFNISSKKQSDLLARIGESTQQYIGQTLSTVAGIVGVVVLLPIYIFLILYYKPLFIHFFYDVFDSEHEQKISDVLTETKTAVQSYIYGLLIETLMVAVLNAVALLILGVKYPILIGVIGAILNLIPYIGGLVAIALPVLMSLVTGDRGLTTPSLIIAAYIVIQFIDNNIIVPSVVSSKVEVNALVSIVIVLLGGALWGVAGMFLSIPFIAIFKIVFDRIEALQPWGRLLGVSIKENVGIKREVKI